MSNKLDENHTKENNLFNLDKLNKLASHHKKLMSCVQLKMENQEIKSNEELYNFITAYLTENRLNKAFPVGISINNIIAHDSYHPEHIIIFNEQRRNNKNKNKQHMNNEYEKRNNRITRYANNKL